MALLHRGDSGPAVTALQNKLIEHGIALSGGADGGFGTNTRSALIKFQNSQGLPPVGFVGALTAAKLGLDPPEAAVPSGMPSVTAEIAGAMLPDAPAGNIGNNLPLVLVALADAALTSLPLVLASIATIRAETAGFAPIDEGVSKFNTSGRDHPFDLYDNRGDLGNHGPPDGAAFKGRGFVQLTGRTNYAKFGPIIGVPSLVDQPDQANDPTIAAKLLAAFVKDKVSIIAAALARNDMLTARKAVNGGSHGLDDFTDAFHAGDHWMTTLKG